MSDAGRILMIDDQPGQIELHLAALERLGFGVDLMTDANDAESRFKGSCLYRCVIVDQMMAEPASVKPGDLADGLETGAYLLQILRSNNNNQPAIMLTQVYSPAVMSCVWKYMTAFRKSRGMPELKSSSNGERERLVTQEWGVRIWEKGIYKPHVFASAISAIVTPFH